MTLRTGDLVAFATVEPEPRHRLGIVIGISFALGLVRIMWCDGHISLHSEMFLKRIA